MKQLHVSFATTTVVQRCGMRVGDSSCYRTVEVRALRPHYMPRTENSVQWVHGGLFPDLLSRYKCLLPDLTGTDKLPNGWVLRKQKCPRPDAAPSFCSRLLSQHITSDTPYSSFHPFAVTAASPTPLLCWHFTLMLLVDIIHFSFIYFSFCAQKILRILHLILTYMFLRNHSKYFFSYASGAWSSNDSSHKCTHK